MEGDVLELTGTTFPKVVEGSKELVVIEFYTTTCPNCRIMEPIIRELAKELKDTAVFGRVNAQVERSLAMRYGVMGVPTFKFFCSGKPIAEDVGAMPNTLLMNTIKDLIHRRRECISGSTRISYEMDGYG